MKGLHRIVSRTCETRDVRGLANHSPTDQKAMKRENLIATMELSKPCRRQGRRMRRLAGSGGLKRLRSGGAPRWWLRRPGPALRSGTIGHCPNHGARLPRYLAIQCFEPARDDARIELVGDSCVRGGTISSS